MADPISLSVAVAGVAVGGATLALQSASSAYKVYHLKRKGKKDAAVPAQHPTQQISQQQPTQQLPQPQPTQYIPQPQPEVKPSNYAGGKVDALPDGYLTSGLNPDAGLGWATITTTETVCFENGQPVTKQSRVELTQAVQCPQTQPYAAPINMPQTTQKMQPMISDSKRPMLPPHCSIAQVAPAHDHVPWQQLGPPPPYEEPINAQNRKRNRFIKLSSR